MQTIIVPLIPRLPEYLHTSNDNAAWALTATLLTGAVSTPIAGRLGDMYGKRLILAVTLTAVVIGSVVCALAESLVPFLIGRGLQGLGMGAIALGISILRDALPPNRLGGAVAAMSASRSASAVRSACRWRPSSPSTTGTPFSGARPASPLPAWRRSLSWYRRRPYTGPPASTIRVR
ncbi:hypothetical protein GCM10010528_29550 [Gordonia defluvii]|jgi:MFS family permease|uniref:Major facilitator superfamily (MFS) profile domain-containing protein n=1 Tax=Gordonia defluvii TaxID=283718 RepID=A0ABP6LNS6_9ACTN